VGICLSSRTTTRWSFGDDESKLKDYAWYEANADLVERIMPMRWGPSFPIRGVV